MVRPGQAASATFFSAERWADVGASEEVVAALAALGITRPSHIQVGRLRRQQQGPALVCSEQRTVQLMSAAQACLRVMDVA